jgi:hypothetical protein
MYEYLALHCDVVNIFVLIDCSLMSNGNFHTLSIYHQRVIRDILDYPAICEQVSAER